MTIITQFSDSRLLKLQEILQSGHVKLLSIDVFDTLLGRCVPSPLDVFLRLGTRLFNKGLLANNHSAETFAALRYRIEYEARKAQQAQYNNREVTLKEIYDLFPPHIILATADEVTAEENATEHELCFANENIVSITKLAANCGIKIAIISNSYYSEDALRKLISEKAPDMPALDGFFVSSDRRHGKADGLFQSMLDHFDITAHDCVHIGDNPVADKQTSERLGATYIDLGISEQDTASSLCADHSEQLDIRAIKYGGLYGDYGLTWLRQQGGYWGHERWVKEQLPYYTFGTQMMGPLLTGFSGWVSQRAKIEKTDLIFGLAREGHLLNQLVASFDSSLNTPILKTSRLAAALASFVPEHPEYLEDFLTRRGHWTLEALLKQLGFDRQDVTHVGNPAATLEEVTPKELTRKLLNSPLAADLFANSARRRRSLLKHLKTIGALQNKKLFLLDLGYAATIQRALQRIFTIFYFSKNFTQSCFAPFRINVDFGFPILGDFFGAGNDTCVAVKLRHDLLLDFQRWEWDFKIKHIII
jgi:predicted HAD superfamily hydrolase